MGPSEDDSFSQEASGICLSDLFLQTSYHVPEYVETSRYDDVEIRIDSWQEERFARLEDHLLLLEVIVEFLDVRENRVLLVQVEPFPQVADGILHIDPRQRFFSCPFLETRVSFFSLHPVILIIDPYPSGLH